MKFRRWRIAANFVWLSVLASGCRDHDDAASASTITESTAAAASAAADVCGRTGQPDCPLQHWMKATLQAYQRTSDYPRLGRSLEELAAHAPQDYSHWRDLAEHALRAADDRDAEALREACKNCHQMYRARYRRERRASPVW
jgi:hypothetical protein